MVPTVLTWTQKIAAMLGVASVLVAQAQDAAEEASVRRQLFSNPTAPMADVLVSESVIFLSEGQAAEYTIQLTHAPGMREDETV